MRAHQTIGDSICQDPRATATALCIGATLNDLPQELNVFWDPAIQANNLAITTDSNSAGKLDLTDLELSSVKPRLTGAGVPVVPNKSDVLVATGAIEGIDHEILVTGNLGLPVSDGGTGRIDLTASIEIEKITATVKNFIAPNPFPRHHSRPARQQAPARRQRRRQHPEHGVVPSAGRVVPGRSDDQERRRVRLPRHHDDDGVDPQPTGTSVINVNFGKDFAVRAYADIAPDNTTRIIGDVLLEQIPAGLSFCFRGAKDPLKLAGAGQANYCDDPTVEAKPEDGAFQFLGSPSAPNLDGLDVDAFVRAVTGSTTNIISGRLNIDNIAYRIEGAIPSGGGKRLDVVPEGQARQPRRHRPDPVRLRDLRPAAVRHRQLSGRPRVRLHLADPRLLADHNSQGAVPAGDRSRPVPVGGRRVR